MDVESDYIFYDFDEHQRVTDEAIHLISEKFTCNNDWVDEIAFVDVFGNPTEFSIRIDGEFKNFVFGNMTLLGDTIIKEKDIEGHRISIMTGEIMIYTKIFTIAFDEKEWEGRFSFDFPPDCLVTKTGEMLVYFGDFDVECLVPYVSKPGLLTKSAR